MRLDAIVRGLQRDPIVVAADAAKGACIERLQRAIQATKQGRGIMPLTAEECVTILEHMTWDEIPEAQAPPPSARDERVQKALGFAASEYQRVGYVQDDNDAPKDFPAPCAAPSKCIGNDPTCPCQDGDACHYRLTATTAAMSLPPSAAPRRIVFVNLLETLYLALPSATELPAGTYDGVSTPIPIWPLWEGKVFSGDTVINRIGGKELIRGEVSLKDGEVVIQYPVLIGLTDYLRPVAPGVYLGWTQPGRVKVWFLLTKVQGETSIDT